MSVNKGINETQRVPQAVAAGSSTEIIDSIRSSHKETVELLSHVNHTLSMYKLQISDLKAQLDDIKQTMQSDTFKLNTFNQTIMQELQHIKESDMVMKSDMENIKNTISKILSQPANQSAGEPASEPASQSAREPATAAMPSTDSLSNLLNNEINNTTTDSDLLTQLTSEPQKVTVAVPKAPRGRRPRK